MKIHFGIISCLIAMFAVSQSWAVTFNSGAAVNSGFALNDGTDLATGSLIRLGVFTISDSLVTANAMSYSYLDANFIEVGTGYIGQGNPAAGSGEGDPVNNGLFNNTILSIDTRGVGLNVAGAQLSYWVFNAATANAATQYGVFSSSLSSWTIPRVMALCLISVLSIQTLVT